MAASGEFQHIPAEVYEIPPPGARTILPSACGRALSNINAACRNMLYPTVGSTISENGGSKMIHGRRKITWAAVADGGKALILVNDGTDQAPVLSVVARNEIENPPALQQGTDKPGRRSGSGPDQRSAMETTDWHEFEESRFVDEFAGRLNRSAQRGLFERLILVAPPKVLGQLRASLSGQAASCVVVEIGSDLTGHPVDEIEKHIAKALAG
jgi:protein required for attachment to host cells